MWNLRSLYLVNLFLLMAPRLARAGWGDERWGELVWSGAAPEVPLLLSPWLQGFLTALLLMTSVLRPLGEALTRLPARHRITLQPLSRRAMS